MPWELIIAIAGLMSGMVIGRVAARVGAKDRGKSEGESFFYLKAINHLLAGDLGQAREELSKAVQLDSQRVEGYIALGTLFRNLGDPERAILVHRGVTCREGLTPEMMVQALHELGLDYKAAGMMEKAKETFAELVRKSPKFVDGWVLLRQTQEDLGEWEEALKSQEKVSKLSPTGRTNIEAHLFTELAKRQMARGKLKEAKSALKKAASLDSKCVDAYLHLGDLYAQEGDDSKAAEVWSKVLVEAPQFAFLAYERLEHAYYRMGKLSALEALLREGCDRDSHIRFLLARHLKKKGELREATRLLEALVEDRPSWAEARKELLALYREQGLKDKALEECDRLAEGMREPFPSYVCGACGKELGEVVWRCPECRSWDTIKRCFGSDGG